MSARRERRGATALEFALIWPTFAMMTLGIIDSSMMLWQRMSLEWAAERGCRGGAMIDPGNDYSNWSEVVSRATYASTTALEGYGVTCGDCSINVQLTTNSATNINSLDCTMQRTSSTVVGVLPAMLMDVEVLTRMEFQR